MFHCYSLLPVLLLMSFSTMRLEDAPNVNEIAGQLFTKVLHNLTDSLGDKEIQVRDPFVCFFNKNKHVNRGK